MTERKLVTYEEHQRTGLFEEGTGEIICSGVQCACCQHGEYLTRANASRITDQPTGRLMQFAWCDKNCGSTVYLVLPLPNFVGQTKGPIEAVLEEYFAYRYGVKP